MVMKSGWKWSLLADRDGIPVGWAADGANRSDQALLAPTLSAADQRGLVCDIETLHPDRGYAGDPATRVCEHFGVNDVMRPPKRPPGAARGQPKTVALGKRWTIERTNSWLSNLGKI